LRASSASVKLCRYRGLFCIERHRTERGDQSFTLAGADEETRSDFAIWSVRAGGEGTVLTWWPTTATQTIMFPPGELAGDGAAVDAATAETEARGGLTEAVPGWFAGRCGGRRRGLY
jgi:hypothetical protein